MKTVQSGDSCATMASKCGISGADFLNYNPAQAFYSKLTPGHKVCCSSGTLQKRDMLSSRGECRTQTVQSGNICATMATKCGIHGADILCYNPAQGFCSKLTPGQQVYCSSGSLQQKRDLLSSRGECRAQTIQSGDSCAALVTKCGISGADLLKYNPAKGFCSKITPGQHYCCSSGILQ